MDKLKWAVRAMAMPAAKQVELFPKFVNVADELALAWEEGLSVLDAAGNSISNSQLNAIRRMDDKILAMSGPDNSEYWTEVALRESAKWEELRRAATELAKEMGWSIDTPGEMSGFYIAPSN